jgi:hypothetical protein
VGDEPVTDSDLTSAQREVRADPDDLLARARLAALEDRLGRPRGSMLTGQLLNLRWTIRGGGRVMLLEFDKWDAWCVFLGETTIDDRGGRLLWSRGALIKVGFDQIKIDEECLP